MQDLLEVENLSYLLKDNHLPLALSTALLNVHTEAAT